MPKPTQGELIRELELTVESQKESLIHLGKQFEKIEREVKEQRDAVGELRRHEAIVQTEIANLKKIRTMTLIESAG